MQCLVTQLCLTLCPPGSSVHWGSPGKHIGVGCHTLLQESSRPRDWTRVSCIAGRFFTSWATREAHSFICWTKKYENNVMSKMNKLNKDNFSPSFWNYSSLIDESKSLIWIFFLVRNDQGVVTITKEFIECAIYIYDWILKPGSLFKFWLCQLTRWVTWGKSLKVSMFWIPCI